MRGTRTSTERTASRLARLTAVLALSASALLCATGPGHAAKDPLPADIPDYQAALVAVKSPEVRAAVCRFLSVPVPQGGAEVQRAIPEKADPCEGVPTFTLKDPLPVNEVTRGFVEGTAQPIAAEAVRLSHLVSSLSVSVDNRQATVVLAQTKGGGWHLAAVRDGDSDAIFAGKADVGSLVFTEPQIRGWYQLRLVTVTPLNDQAREGLGGRASMSLSDYQALLKSRYGDKLAGSEYDTKGFSSGYGPTVTKTSVQDDTPSVTPLVVGGSGVVLVLAAGAFLLRRRRRATTD